MTIIKGLHKPINDEGGRLSNPLHCKGCAHSTLVVIIVQQAIDESLQDVLLPGCRGVGKAEATDAVDRFLSLLRIVAPEISKKVFDASRWAPRLSRDCEKSLFGTAAS